MSPPPDFPKPTRLRGLDPERLLGLLDDDLAASVPKIPGWHISGVAGQGGSGIVWRAERESDGTLAAIKIAPPYEPDTVERIEREAGFLRDLRHPHIVGLLETGPLLEGSDEGGLYMAMEFIDGPALQHDIPEQGLSPQQAYQWFREIATAVAYAHDCGILHRDLKPGNVLLAPDGHLKVADFGLAGPVHRRVHMLSLTRAGQVAGTAEYLPPEAYRRGYQPAPSADIFALGVMLHEMLTGTPPRGAWQPASTRRGVDVRIDDLIRRAIDPDPENRWPDAKAMLAELDKILGSSPRYSGTPRVTLPIRVTDCLWTVLGLGILLSGFSSLLNLRKASFSLPLDLVGNHSHLVGGFTALFFLLLPCIPLALWQIIRLRRFRHIPMREALPSPFGVKLGYGRTAAWLVATGQFFCFLLPLLLLLAIYTTTCLVWLKPDDPPWIHGLVVTTWENPHEIISPWKFQDGNRFWLHETYGPPGHPLTRYLGRAGFPPGYVPIIMVIAAGLMGLALLATLYTACRGWWVRDRRLQVISSLALLGLFGTTLGMGYHARCETVEHEANRPTDGWVHGRMTAHLGDHLHRLVSSRADPAVRPEPSHIDQLYAPMVDYRDHGTVGRLQIAKLLAAEIPPSAEIFHHGINYAVSWNPACGSFRVFQQCLEYRDAEDQAECSLLNITLEGIVTIDGRTAIQRELLEVTPVYQALPRTADRAEAVAWAMALQRVFGAASGCPNRMADGVSPLLDEHLTKNQETVGSGLPGPEMHPLFPLLLDGTLIARPEATRIVGPQPGGRTRITIPLHDPRSGNIRDLTVDLVCRQDRWRAVALSF